MSTQPKLTICVPSRNRQKYFQKTIEGMVRDPRSDVQFVFTDNSDDPSVMNTYMERYKDDPRIIYLPTTDQILPMIENWERTIQFATGEWVTFVGDDDHCDPAVTDLIIRLQKRMPDLEALSWSALSYSWPVEGEPICSVLLPLGVGLFEPNREQLNRRMFGWEWAGIAPGSGFSIYHSAIRSTLLARIRQKAGGRYFEHPTVDYDMAMKVICTGKRFVYCERPFSVMGVCPESNSFALGRLDDMKKKIDAFNAELGRDVENDSYMKDLPFGHQLGVAGSIVIVQQWFKWRYKFHYPNWEKNFVRSLARGVEIFRDREGFELMKEANLNALRRWNDGRYVEYFKPEFKDEKTVLGSGFTETGVYVRADIGGAANPHELFDILNDFMPAISDIDETRFYELGDEPINPAKTAPKAVLQARHGGNRRRAR